MNGPASLAIHRYGLRGSSLRPGASIATHPVRARLVPVQIQHSSYIHDVGTGGSATLSHLGFYNPVGNQILSVQASHQATSTGGVRILVPFRGTAFGLVMLGGQASSATNGAFNVVVDGICYEGRRDSEWLSSINTSGMGTRNNMTPIVFAEDLDDGDHTAELFFNGPPTSGDGTQNWFIGGWLLDELAGYYEGTKQACNVSNTRTAVPNSQSAIYTFGAANTAQGISEIWLHNADVSTRTVTFQLSSATVQVVSLAAGASTRLTFATPITFGSGLTWAADAANAVFFVLLGGS